MRNLKYSLFLALLSAFILTSCQKEISMEQFTGSGGGGSNANLIGNWKFINLDAKTKSTVEVNDGVDVLKTISLTDYITTDNGGSLKIDASKITSTDLTYTINTTVKGSVYENGTLINTLDFPFTFTLPPSSSTTTYTVVGADSLLFAASFITIGGNTVPSKPSGAKFKIVGDILTLTTAAVDMTTQTVFGFTQTTKNEVNAIATYKRQ